MALRLRRGLDIERSAITFAEGEPLYTTDTKQLYIGDGITPGGVQIGGMNNLIDDTAPQLGNDLDLNTYDITGVGSINVDGNLTITGKVVAEFIEADYRGSIFGNDSAVLVDSNNNALHADLFRSDGVKVVDFQTGLVALDTTPAKALSDINYDIVEIGDVLSWTGSEWAGQTFGGNSTESNILQYVVDVGFVGTQVLKTANDDTIINIDTGYVNIGNQKLEELNDVFVEPTSITENDVLTWDGSNWTHRQITIDLGESELPINALLDVHTTNPAINDTLMWDGVNFINQPLPDIAVTLEELEDVLITNLPNTNEILAWDGTKWVNTANQSLNELPDVYLTNPSAGDVLTYDGTQWIASKNIPNLVELNDVDPVFAQNDLITWDGNVFKGITVNELDISVENLSDTSFSSLTTNDIMIYDGFSWVNDDISRITGSLNHGIFYGSLVSNDSSVMVDGDTNSIFAQNITTYDLTIDGDIYSSTNRVSFIGPTNNKVTFQVEADDVVTYKGIRHYTSTPDPSDTNGRILFGENVAGTEKSTTLMLAKNDGFLIAFDQDGAFPTSSFLSQRYENGECKIGIGTTSPATNLDVQGSISNTSFIQFGQLSTAERDVIAPQNGMVIYNTDVNKFQGYAVSAWVDLS